MPPDATAGERSAVLRRAREPASPPPVPSPRAFVALAAVAVAIVVIVGIAGWSPVVALVSLAVTIWDYLAVRAIGIVRERRVREREQGEALLAAWTTAATQAPDTPQTAAAPQTPAGPQMGAGLQAPLTPQVGAGLQIPIASQVGAGLQISVAPQVGAASQTPAEGETPRYELATLSRERSVREWRRAIALRPGIDTQQAEKHAEALARIYDLAKQSDATDEHLADIRSGFSSIALELAQSRSKRRRFGWRSRPRRGMEGEPQSPEVRDELPPGRDS